MQGNGTLEIGDVTISGNKVENMVDGIYYANGSIKITGVPNMENDIYITGQRQLNITSDLTNIQSQIRISNPGGNVAFAVADTQEHAKAAENETRRRKRRKKTSKGNKRVLRVLFARPMARC